MLKGKSILIVEDDEKIRNLMKLYLVNAGFEIWEAEDGRQAKEVFLKMDPCFMIVDLMLPFIQGEDLCTWVRTDQKSEIPLIMVTAKTSEADRINGLKMGADDYVTKPFSPGELVARVETVLRRTENHCNKISYRGLTIKPIKKEVKFEGTPINLTTHEFKLLYYLMKNPNRILSRDQILDELYPNQERNVIDRTIDVHVGKLREKLREKSEVDFIETIRGMGYRFAAY
ncbi:response regulator transcription factor [Fictibacillus fluitans]|uniref:Response regulator transcription factor n=1 Tax=Fictibacillus fluitans TaxID=3058422 RepID=A0ABT8HST7_9BACL|nr:response regulator transcription factor [Fictibacillus sp. NE201]MDN4523337.1 response regulator transcription factor [Fictibacillus sp. NE201]